MCSVDAMTSTTRETVVAEENIRVRLNGIDLVWLKEDDDTGALAYPDHLDSNGNVTWEAALSLDSHAHVCEGGIIMRYGRQIGTMDNLEFL